MLSVAKHLAKDRGKFLREILRFTQDDKHQQLNL